jgi:F-type H+-transporting ATPase subunit b
MLKRMIPMLVVMAGLAMPASRVLAQHEAAPHTSAAPHGDTHVEAAAETHAAGEDHAKAPLLPDFTKRETQLQSLWVIIIFMVLVVVLYFTAWKNVLGGLKNREERIRKDISDANEARAKAEATLREYTQQLATAEQRTRDILAKAAADAERIAASIRTQAQSDAEETKERATRDIEAAKSQAIGEIYEQAATLATTVAEKILRRNLNPNDQRDLVAQSLEQLQTMGKQ